MACLGHRSCIGPQLWGCWLYLGLARHLRQPPAALYVGVSAGWLWPWCQPKEWDPTSSTLALQEQALVWGVAQVILLFSHCSYELGMTMNEVNECLTIIDRKIHYLFTQCLYNWDVRAIHTVDKAHSTTVDSSDHFDKILHSNGLQNVVPFKGHELVWLELNFDVLRFDVADVPQASFVLLLDLCIKAWTSSSVKKHHSMELGKSSEGVDFGRDEDQCGQYGRCTEVL